MLAIPAAPLGDPDVARSRTSGMRTPDPERPLRIAALVVRFDARSGCRRSDHTPRPSGADQASRRTRCRAVRCVARSRAPGTRVGALWHRTPWRRAACPADAAAVPGWRCARMGWHRASGPSQRCRAAWPRSARCQAACRGRRWRDGVMSSPYPGPSGSGRWQSPFIRSSASQGASATLSPTRAGHYAWSGSRPLTCTTAMVVSRCYRPRTVSGRSRPAAWPIAPRRTSAGLAQHLSWWRSSNQTVAEKALQCRSGAGLSNQRSAE